MKLDYRDRRVEEREAAERPSPYVGVLAAALLSAFFIFVAWWFGRI